jgi:hypothetical protein
MNVESHTMNDSLMTQWENRPPAIWGGDKTQQINSELAILETLLKKGYETTHDGQEVKSQIAERRALIHDITQM